MEKNEAQKEIEQLKAECKEILEEIKSIHPLDYDAYLSDTNGNEYSLNRKILYHLSGFNVINRPKDGTEFVFNHNFRNLKIHQGILNLLIFPDSVKVIADRSFSEMLHLHEVHFGNGLKMIGDYAFENNEFKYVLLPESLIYLGDGAFRNNKELEYIYIPENIEYIGKDVFAGCPKFKHVLTSSNPFGNKVEDTFAPRGGNVGFINWEEEERYLAFRKSMIVKEEPNYYHYYSDYSDRDNWDALTDGMYGDYPEDGWDGDPEFMGY